MNTLITKEKWYKKYKNKVPKHTKDHINDANNNNDGDQNTGKATGKINKAVIKSDKSTLPQCGAAQNTKTNTKNSLRKRLYRVEIQRIRRKDHHQQQ